MTTTMTTTNGIHVPSSLMKKKKNNRNKGSLSHRDVANILHIQKNPELLKRFRRTRHPPQRIRDDFVTLYLVKWSLLEVTKATHLIISLINHRNETTWRDACFANMTPITYFDNGYEHTISYRLYYNMIYQMALDKCRSRATFTTMDESSEHLVTLLRACFIIGFVCDERIRRFVMANHSIHTNYLSTKPPDKEKAHLFIRECSSLVNAYLSYSDEHEELNILSMTTQCVSVWIHSCMIK